MKKNSWNVSLGTWRSAASVTLMGLLAVGASCDRASEAAQRCEVPDACKGVRGHCFILGAEGGGAGLDALQGFRDASGPIQGALEIAPADENNPYPFPYFDGPNDEGFELSSTNTTGVFDCGDDEKCNNEEDFELNITSCRGFESGTTWGWCAVDDNGNFQEHSHSVSQCDGDDEGATVSTLRFPAVGGEETKYRLRIWGVQAGGAAIAGDPKIKASGDTSDPPASFPAPIPVCPAEYDYYEDCLPGQYTTDCPTSTTDYSANGGASSNAYDYGAPLNVTAPFWLYRVSNSTDPDGRISVAAKIATDINGSSNHYGPASNISPLTTKIALSEGGEVGAQHMVFYNITNMASYSAAVTEAPTLPNSLAWHTVSYEASDGGSNTTGYENLYDSTAAFLNCLSGLQPASVAYAQVSATNDDDSPASVAIIFPVEDGSEYKSCATGSASGGASAFCDGDDC